MKRPSITAFHSDNTTPVFVRPLVDLAQESGEPMQNKTSSALIGFVVLIAVLSSGCGDRSTSPSPSSPSPSNPSSSSSLPAQEIKGPFGLCRGMTQEQVIQVVGKGAVMEAKGADLMLSTVPKPHPAFSSYSLSFSPRDGLLRIVALGKNIRTNDFGDALRSSFVEINDTISQTYGQPTITLDHVRAGSIWNQPQDWMMGLVQKERLVARWKTALPNRIHEIRLQAIGITPGLGYLGLGYEFEGWDEYDAAAKKKAGTVF